MTAYLSKIAARFDGSGVNDTTENQSGTQTLMPSRISFGSNNAVDIGFPPATFSNEYTFLDSISSDDDEPLTNNGKILKPAPHYIPSSPVETIRTLFYSEDTIEDNDQKTFEQSNPVIPQKSVNSKPNSLPQQAHEYNKLKPKKEEYVDENTNEHPVELTSNDSQTYKKEQNFFYSNTFQKKQLKNKKIQPVLLKDKKNQVVLPSKKEQKEPLLEIKAASKEKKPRKLQTNFSFDTINQKKIIKSQPIFNQLKPSIKKQRLANSIAQKKQVENKIRIGSISVEILSHKPKKVKTRTQQLPQQKVMSPSKSSANQTRFPLRFGLKQM